MRNNGQGIVESHKCPRTEGTQHTEEEEVSSEIMSANEKLNCCY